MTALYARLLTVTLTIGFGCANGQVHDQMIRQKVLQKAIVDSIFIFGKWTERTGTETHLTYLGSVTTKHGQTYKILNSIWYWGLAHRATSRILIFTNDNKYVGNYYVTVTTDLPTKMEKGKLIFKNTDGDCDKNLMTILDLKKDLPKQFFRTCKGKYGDIYSLDTEF